MRRLIFGTKGYHWFERVVVAILTAMVCVSVVLSLAQSGVALYHVVVSDTHLLDHDAFIKVFGAFMTVLIALEFNHTVLPDITTRSSMVKVRAVLLVALLALARKVVLVDFKEMASSSIFALAVLIVSVAVAYWVVVRGEKESSESKSLDL